MIKFIEIVNSSTRSTGFLLEEMWINRSHVVRVQSAPEYKKLLYEGQLPDDLNQDHEFTTLTINVGGIVEQHIVVGSTTEVVAKLNCDSRQLLMG